MTRAELIEKMKNNRTCWGWLTEEKKECLGSVPDEYRLRLNRVEHIPDWQTDTNDLIAFGDIFRISPDYQPEPEFEYLEVTDGDGYLSVGYNGCCRNLCAIQNHVNFVEIQLLDGSTWYPIGSRKPVELFNEKHKLRVKMRTN